MRLTVLMNAGPWVPLPPAAYGGLENVVTTLVSELRARGVRVVVATVAASTIAADGQVWAFRRPQFEALGRPLSEGIGIAHVHMQEVLRAVERVEPDIVHDHLEVVGPQMLAMAWQPTLHTLHWDTGRNAEFYASFDGRGAVFFATVSERQLELAPLAVREQALGAVPLAVDPAAFPYRPDKDEHHVLLARISPLKGQHVAARLGVPVILAGPIQDERYWHEDVEPHVDGTRVRWVGVLGGGEKLDVLSRARAALFPIQWDEPGGTAVVEALACGTPVIGMRRGCMPSLVEHGVTGFLADTEAEFAEYVRRAGEIDPAACRRAVTERFSAGAMADRYLELYAEVRRRTRSGSPDAPAPQVPA